MRRGELYRVHRGNRNDPKAGRIFVIVSRQVLVDSKFSTVICAPTYSRFDGVSTQFAIGTDEGLKKPSAIFCDELLSIEKAKLTDYLGCLSGPKLQELDRCLRIALNLD